MYFRTGTFHKLIDGRWISFGVSTKTSVSADKDEVYLEVDFENREGEPLEFIVSPNQHAPDMTLTFPNEPAKPASPVAHMDVFTLSSDQIRLTTVSNLAQEGQDGWKWEVPAHSKSTAYFAIVLQQASTPAPAVVASDIAQRQAQAERALRDRLQWASANLPQVSTADPAFDDFYRRCILTVLEARWDRENFTVRPFYAAGSWIFTIPWDTSYASEMLSVLDPKGLREAFLTYVRAGLLTNSWVPWNGNANTYFPGTKLRYWYAQNPFAEMRIIQDYLTQTGDTAFLDHTEEGATILEWMKRMAANWKNNTPVPMAFWISVRVLNACWRFAPMDTSTSSRPRTAWPLSTSTKSRNGAVSVTIPTPRSLNRGRRISTLPWTRSFGMRATVGS